MRRYCWIVMVLSACLPVCTALAAELVNGDFEDGLNGWTVEGSVTADVTPDNDFALFQENASGPKSRIIQVFNIPAGVDTLTFTYLLSWHQARNAADDSHEPSRKKQRGETSSSQMTGPVYRSDVQASSTSRAGFPRDSFSAFLLDPDTLQRLLPPPGEPPEAFDDFFFADNTGRVDYHVGYVSVSAPHDDGTQTVTLDVSSLTAGQSIRLEFGLAAGPDGYVTIAVVDDVIATCVADDDCDDGNPCTADACSQGACVSTPIPDCIPCTSPGDCSDGNECSDDICNAEGVCENPNSPAGSPCGDPDDTACDNPDTCDGGGTCQENVEPAVTQCRPALSECDLAEFCDGSGSCPDDVFQPPETACGDGSDTTCDNPDTCDGAGTCQDNFEPETIECRPTASECDLAEFCDGTGSCPPDAFQPAGAACGDAGDTLCDNPDTCDGAGNCQPNYEPETFGCRPAANMCDVPEFCTGSDAACPPDGFVPDGVECPDGVYCNGEETCQLGVCTDGQDPCVDQGHCDEIQSRCLSCIQDDECVDDDPCTEDRCVENECVSALIPGCRPCTAPADCGDGNDCTQDVCNAGGTCENPNEPQGAACGDQADTACDTPDTCDGAGTCQDNAEPATTECRSAANECDQAEFCDGVGSCPDDAFQSAGTACGDAGDTLCDNPDTCDGGGTCQDNAEPTTTECRPSASECDQAEFCDGAGSCPDDAFQPVGTACGDTGDTLCDDPDTCDGAGSCQDNAEPTTTECRPAATECDEAEFCDGAGSCPIDAFQPAGTACGDASDTFCDNPDTCDGSGACQANPEPTATECRPSANECDVPEFCDGAGSCPIDAFQPAGTACGDASDTTCDSLDTCDGAGTCQDNAEPTTTECRPAANECDEPEFCDGAGSCPGDTFQPVGTACGDAGDTTCDDPDACDGAGTCQDNAEPTTTECRPAANECDEPEFCDGAGSCPVDAFQPAGTACGGASDTLCDDPDTCDGAGACQDNIEPATTECRPAASECDVSEFCTGSDAACPSDGFVPDGTSCADGVFCNGEETCHLGVCADGQEPCVDQAHCEETPPRCLACVQDAECGDDDPCTEDRCEENECVSSTIPGCRRCSVPTDCDDSNDCTQDVCNASGTCENPNEPQGAACGDDADAACDNPDTCDGAGNCRDNVEPDTTECRPAANECDVTEFCDGVGTCPVDAFQPVGTACGDASDTVCDDPDTCNSVGNCSRNYAPPGAECRASTDECDPTEFCSGSSPMCPQDVSLPDGAPCGDELFCDGEEACQGGICTGGPQPCIDQAHCDEADDVCLACVADHECDDSDPCTQDTCVDNECANTMIPGCGAVVHLDIKPGSCPNPVNTQRRKGVVPVAIVGTASFDVLQIDLASLLIGRADGVGMPVSPMSPRDHSGEEWPWHQVEDVATPFPGELCDCHTLVDDGIDDLSLKFASWELVDALELDELEDDTILTVTVTGMQIDGTAFSASDCIRVLNKDGRSGR